jgi:hypothetical protein
MPSGPASTPTHRISLAWPVGSTESPTTLPNHLTFSAPWYSPMTRPYGSRLGGYRFGGLDCWLSPPLIQSRVLGDEPVPGLRLHWTSRAFQPRVLANPTNKHEADRFSFPIFHSKAMSFFSLLLEAMGLRHYLRIIIKVTRSRFLSGPSLIYPP